MQEVKRVRQLPKNVPTLLDINQVSELTGLKVESIYNMKAQGRIPFKKVGCLLRFDLNELNEWMSRDNSIRY